MQGVQLYEFIIKKTRPILNRSGPYSDFIMHFLVQFFTPLLAALFFHADLSHIPFQISKSRI